MQGKRGLIMGLANDRSLAWGALHLWKDGRRNEAACARAPRTAAAVESLPLCDLPGRTPTPEAAHP